MNRRTMKKIIGLCCATFLLSGCHIYKSYDRPESIDATGIYRDPVAANDTLAANGNRRQKNRQKQLRINCSCKPVIQFGAKVGY